MSHMGQVGLEAGTHIAAMPGWSLSFAYRDTKGDSKFASDYGTYYAQMVTTMAASYGGYPPLGFFGTDNQSYESHLQTIDLEVGRDIGIGSGSRVTFGLRQAKISHKASSTDNYYDYYTYTTYTYNLENQSDFTATGIRVAAELNYPVANKFSLMGEGGFSIMNAKGKAKGSVTENGTTLFSYSQKYPNDIAIAGFDLKLGVGYQVNDRWQVFGGWRYEKLSGKDTQCTGTCNTFDFEYKGLFAGAKASF